MFNRDYLKSLAEVVFLAWLTAFVGFLAADGFDVVSLGAWKAAAVAAFPAAAGAAYGILVKPFGDTRRATLTGKPSTPDA